MASTMKPPAHAPEFLAAFGWEGAEILPLAGDASFRRYFRVVSGERSAVLMDAPPPHEDPRPFAAVAEWLVRRGLSAPEILARDLEWGLLLLDDFGKIVDAVEIDVVKAGGSRVHCCPGPPMVAARPPESSTHAPSDASVPDAMTWPEAGSAAEVDQFVGAGCGVLADVELITDPYAPAPRHSALSPDVPCTSAKTPDSRTNCPETGKLTRCQPVPGE